MAKRDLLSSQSIQRELRNLPDIRFNIDEKYGVKAKIKLTNYKANDFERDLSKAAKQANQVIANSLGEALDAAMLSSEWAFDRDIIDTGRLRDSLRITTTPGGIAIDYNVPYAALVHYGGYITPYGNKKLEKVYIPGRPWVESVLRGGGPVPKFDFEGIYRDAIRSVFG